MEHTSKSPMKRMVSRAKWFDDFSSALRKTKDNNLPLPQAFGSTPPLTPHNRWAKDPLEACTARPYVSA